MSENTDFEAQLKRILDQLLGRGETPPQLVEAIRYSLLAPGKRIRPRLMLACAEMIGLSERAVLPAACALEMIHCFTLIHDDLPCLDNDDFRRGLPSCHKKFGEALALLAGDALLALGFDALLLGCGEVPGNNLIQALRRLTQASGPRGVIGGQVAEMALCPQSTLESLEKVHAAKTGALFEAALLIPLDLAGILENSPERASVKNFAAALGLSFQMGDDLEDFCSENDPRNILFFKTREKATQESLRRMSEAKEAFRKILGSKANALLDIADSVEAKIKRALNAVL